MLARRSAADLRLLLDDILEHAKVELGNPVVRAEDFDLRGLVRRISDLMAPVARAMTAALREHDVLARWGGEEFLVMLPDTQVHEARISFERLRRLLSRDEAWGEQVHLRVSFSGGLTAWRTGEALRDALARADRALYEAKASGRDRLVEK
jgi:diguanylate cyclase (GGDEF)-like protein